MERDLVLPSGFRFHPTDDELVHDYLVRKCRGLALPSSVIAGIDLYKYNPWQLPGTARSSSLFVSLHLIASFSHGVLLESTDWLVLSGVILGQLQVIHLDMFGSFCNMLFSTRHPMSRVQPS